MDDISDQILKRREPKVESGEKVWLTSMNDLIALILTFFVMIFAVSEITGKTKIMINYIRTSFVEKDLRIRQSLFPHLTIDDIALRTTYASGYIYNLIASEMGNNRLFDGFTVSLDQSFVVISLPPESYFASYSTQSTSRMEKSLTTLTGLLSRFPIDIAVVGHTNPLPIATRLYQDNWELSLARAQEVASLLKEKGFQGKITTIGRSYGSYDQLPSELDPDQRLRFGRRIDIVLNSQETLPFDRLTRAY